MSDRPKILAFAGSVREQSYTKRIIKVAAEGARNAGADVTVVDLRDYPMPIYDPDAHVREGFHGAALEFQKLVRANDGFLVATPEYNGSLSGVLKNAIDWASRPSDLYPRSEVFQGKVAAIASASPGRFGGVRALPHLRDVFTSVNVHVIPTELAVPMANTVFDGETDTVTDESAQKSLERLGSALVDAVRRLRIGANRTEG